MKIYSVVAALMMVGFVLCQISFDWDHNLLVFPLLNLAGIAGLALAPWIALILCQLKSRDNRYIINNLTGAWLIGSLISLYFSSGQGYLSGDQFFLVFMGGMAITAVLDLGRKTCF